MNNSTAYKDQLNYDLALTERVQNMLKEGADINGVDIFEETILVQAVKSNLYHTTLYLVNQGADLKVTDLQGHSILYHAYRNQNYSLVSLLQSENCHFSAKEEEGGLEDLFVTACFTRGISTLETGAPHLDYFLSLYEVDAKKLASPKHSLMTRAVAVSSAGVIEVLLGLGLEVQLTDIYLAEQIEHENQAMGVNSTPRIKATQQVLSMITGAYNR